MFDLLMIPDNCIYNRDIPLEKIYDNQNICDYHISSLIWNASLKPQLTGLTEVINEDERVEEIQFFTMILSSDYLFTDNYEAQNKMYTMLRTLFRSIKYHVVLILVYENKFKILTCNFTPGKEDWGKNILKGISISDWVHPDKMLPSAKKMIDKINSSIINNNDLQSIYNEIHTATHIFNESMLKRKTVISCISMLIGKIDLKTEKEVLKYSTQFSYHAILEKGSKYEKARKTSNYIFMYEKGDIWYCLNMYERTKNVLEKRNYNDFEEFLFRVREKTGYFD